MKYGKTKQFGDTIRDMKHALRYKGVNEDGEPIYSNDGLPILTFNGTVKLHGTNAGITWNAEEGLRYMSRNNFVTNGHFDFPEIMSQESEAVEDLIVEIVNNSDYQLGETISIYGEWVGPGVQKGVAVSQLPKKTWFVFAVKITDEDGDGRWFDGLYDLDISSSDRIVNINSFQTFSLDIDLENPTLSQNTLVELTNLVENFVL